MACLALAVVKYRFVFSFMLAVVKTTVPGPSPFTDVTYEFADLNSV